MSLILEGLLGIISIFVIFKLIKHFTSFIAVFLFPSILTFGNLILFKGIDSSKLLIELIITILILLSCYTSKEYLHSKKNGMADLRYNNNPVHYSYSPSARKFLLQSLLGCIGLLFLIIFVI